MATSAVKQVLRGTTSIGAVATTAVVTLSPSVDTSKSIIFFSIKATMASMWDHTIRATFDSGSQITFSRTGNTGTVSISWEVVEFTSTSGVLVQHGSVTMDATSKTVTLGTTVDTSKSWIMLSWNRSSTTMNQSHFAKAKFTGSGASIQIDSLSTMSQIVNYQVIQYDACSVQTLELSNENAQDVQETITAVTLNKTAIFTSCSAYLTQTYNETMIYKVTLYDSTHVRFHKYGGAGNGFAVTCFVVSFTDDTIVEEYTATFLTTDTSLNQTITSRDRTKSVTNTSNVCARMIGSSDSATNDGNFADHHCERTSDTNVTVSKVGTGANSRVSFQAIAFLTIEISAVTGEPRTTGRGIMRGCGRGIM